ncbi:hydroxyacylglutathione hydrolase [Marinobacterium stanieri]|uniref:Hydroxyacylglutathione hydrolase n=1 Tax=Marinobacterium stanieri TaxID=49186 RepID=A0A1N6RJM3_9GAMM|nr:hydroxyacylglutathione hydrolase [Marinobacterium stanieri]SIQ28987.1 hydroxyacylglutathione hydrolase [Marinobacterium stanieri]
MFTVTPIPAFNDNYIWALTRASAGNKAVVVDPGDATPVMTWLQENQLELDAILITHHHADHTGGVAQLVSAFDVPVYGPKDSPFAGISQPLSQGDEIDIIGLGLTIQAVPAHTRDHISFFQPQGTPQLFCGDTLFLAGCGRLFEGTAKQMLDAMHYFASLPDATEVYCTHEYSLANLSFAACVEPENTDITSTRERCHKLRENNQPTLPSTIAQEKLINPYMRTQVQAVINSAEHFSGNALSSDVEVLAALREWKNQF